jgi:polyhydroxyalkanoate synthesis regulator phasin
MTEDSTQRRKEDQGEERGARERMGDGIRSGIGVLSAFKDVLEETIHDARERGDLSAERARELMKGALSKAQTAASEARERLDFANQGEIDELERAVEALAARVAALEARVFGTDPVGGQESGSETEPEAGI